MKRILPIVEGDGDTTAVPALVRRIAEARGIYDLQLLPAHKRGELPAVRRHFDAYLGAALKHEAPSCGSWTTTATSVMPSRTIWPICSNVLVIPTNASLLNLH